MNKNLVIAICLVIAALIGGFFAGISYQKSMRSTFTMGTQSSIMYRRFGQGNQNFRPVRGQILSIDPTGITVKLPDGSSTIIIVGNSTKYAKLDVASRNDLQKGENVMVIGNQNSDGSVTAQNISIASTSTP